MRSRRRREKSRKPWLIALAIVAAALVLAGAYSYFVAHKTATTASSVHASPSPSGLPLGGHGGNTAVNSGPSHDTSPTPEPTISNNPSHPVTAALAAPTETLNNDGGTISLSQCEGADSCTEGSDCNSISGAQCFIEASMGSQTIVVSKTGTIPANNQGVELIWNANQLTPGQWVIQAVAAANGSRAVSGPINLTVTQ